MIIIPRWLPFQGFTKSKLMFILWVPIFGQGFRIFLSMNQENSLMELLIGWHVIIQLLFHLIWRRGLIESYCYRKYRCTCNLVCSLLIGKSCPSKCKLDYI